jgi:hypothetical protein
MLPPTIQTIQTEVFRGVPQSFKKNVGIIDHDLFLPHPLALFNIFQSFDII